MESIITTAALLTAALASFSLALLLTWLLLKGVFHLLPAAPRARARVGASFSLPSSRQQGTTLECGAPALLALTAAEGSEAEGSAPPCGL